MKAILLPLLALVSTAHKQELNIGHAAPPLDVIRWVKGDTVKEFEKGKVYVVEFWATWCGPCKKSIPHITELAHKYAGKATFIGVDVFDQGSEPKDVSYIKKVKAFVDGQKDAMDYRVAVDGPNGAMAKNWLKAYGEGGIPTSFVIDGNGTVAWIGYPTEGLDEAVAAVLAPGYDVSKAAEDRIARKAEEEKGKPLDQRFFDLVEKKNWSAARDLSDQLLSSEPEKELTYAGARFTVLLHTDRGDAYDYARKLTDGLYKNIPPALTGLARTIAQEPGIENPDLGLATSIAQRAIDLSNAKDPRYIETLAIIQARQGKMKDAAATMERAISLCESAKINSALTQEMRDRLAEYRAR